MWISFWNWFVKITGWPVQKICFRTKIYYEDKSVQSRKIKGPAIIISNHTSVFDYAVWLFVFWGRTLRFQMAELLFKKKGLGILLRMLGGIYVNRNAHDFSFITKSENIIKKGGVVGVFPEARIPLPDEERPLEFKPSAAYLTILSGVPVIPVVTDGSYFNKKHANVIIGKPIDIYEITDSDLSDKENIEKVNEVLRNRIIELESFLNEKKSGCDKKEKN
ncbi:MAG: 1-acyl-sn-glycerol-3-phosphate acyltransferase [Lachnospiraceae bacterium]|nr:1-acyl-sn-glycerol-3-phosphate acyltransferase [Lachnospiraceae bacterium]